MSAPKLHPPEPLQAHHRTEGFDSGAKELDDWLHRFAWVNQQAGNARTFVATRAGRVVGYYALATAGAERADFPASIAKGGVPQQVPCLLLARLAVDRTEQGRGLGRGLLVDALRRAIRVSDEVGVRALLLHAREDAARAYYLHLGEFVESPTDPHHLLLHLKHARRLMRPGA